MRCLWLPRVVSQAQWPRRPGKTTRLHSEVVAEVRALVGVDLAQHLRQHSSPGVVKRAVNAAVRAHDMDQLRRSRKSTVVKYVSLLPQHVMAFPTRLPQYLVGAMTAGARALLLCRADALLPRAASACPCCGAVGEARLQHVLLECPHWAASRQLMWDSLAQAVGDARVAAVRTGDLPRVLAVLLTPTEWPGAGGRPCAAIQRFLVEVYRFLQAPSGVHSQAELQRVDNIACQMCHSRGREATLLLCAGCGRGFHTRCLVPALPAVPADDWFCSVCRSVVVGQTGTSVKHVTRRPRREGPWPSG